MEHSREGSTDWYLLLKICNHSNKRIIFVYVLLLGATNGHIKGSNRTQFVSPLIPNKLKRGNCGYRAGAKQRGKRGKFKPSLIPVITGCVRSLSCKTDNLKVMLVAVGRKDLL
ncbi:hypothetical protein CRENBAI_005613 [Crenichthys baileyi]|uniref:Uncharacterized protein n=1 Tax=Crenichthys baileyi TaxID=28760 RepID=A0AAV9RUY2_9TELE